MALKRQETYKGIVFDAYIVIKSITGKASTGFDCAMCFMNGDDCVFIEHHRVPASDDNKRWDDLCYEHLKSTERFSNSTDV